MVLLKQKVSFQESATAPLGRELSIGEALAAIKNGTYKKQVLLLRQLKGKNPKEYTARKKMLPGVCFCGSFREHRRRECLSQYNNLIVIDIDNLSAEEISRIKHVLSKDQHVHSFWASPSGFGIKGLISLQFEPLLTGDDVEQFHKLAFQMLTEYFANKHKIVLDISGSDTTRLCFFSFDPELHLKSEFTPFIVNHRDLKLERSSVSGIQKKEKGVRVIKNEEALSNIKGRNSSNDRNKIQSIIKFLTKRNISITSTNEDWYKVAYAITDAFNYDIGEKYFLKLCRLDGAKHDEEASKRKLRSCYLNSTGEIKFNTIVYFAQKHGYFKKKGAGSPEDGTK